MNSSLPIAVGTTALWRKRRWWKSWYRIVRYDARFAHGHAELDVDLNAVLQGARFPADCWCTLNGAEDACPPAGIGPWVDYPYGRPLEETR
ncbi:hypothetical protein [Kocuria arenosa]|uniref:hypothetical protein n=1 Tax=Kocuria arenosa TaxID=3071446 RepID=UPI0034D4C0A2